MLTVWREPGSVAACYVAGVDTAEGLGHGDYSCIQMLDVRSGEQVAVWHGHIPPDELAHEVFRLALWYRDALTCVESNNHGLTTIVQLRHLGHPNLFRKRTLNRATEGVDGVRVEDDSYDETVADRRFGHGVAERRVDVV